MGIVVGTYTGGGGGGGESVTWGDVTDKPTTFPSDWSQVTSKPATFPADPPAWGDITGKPATYPADLSGLSAVASSGSYDDLADQPALPVRGYAFPNWATDTIILTIPIPTDASVMIDLALGAFASSTPNVYMAKTFAGYYNLAGTVAEVGSGTTHETRQGAASVTVTYVVNGSNVEVHFLNSEDDYHVNYELRTIVCQR